jgi:hypothetical protein
MAQYTVQIPKQFLAGSGCSLTDTSIVLKSFKFTDNTTATTNVTMAMFGTIAYATMEAGTAKEEQISFTGITQNANGTATLTGVTRGLAFTTPYAASTLNRYSHAGGTELVISNTAAFYTQFASPSNPQTITVLYTFTVLPQSSVVPTVGADLTNKTYVDLLDSANVKLTGAQTIAGLKTFSTLPQSSATPTVASDFATKTYVDTTAVAGAPNASTTVKGIVEIATQAEVDAGTDTGGTGALVAVIPSTLNAWSGVSNLLKFGDGSDGSATISSPTTLTRDMYYTDLTVNSTLTTGNYRIFVSGTLSGNGTIRQNGNNGTNGSNGVKGSSSASGGTGGASISGYFTTFAGGDGGVSAGSSPAGTSTVVSWLLVNGKQGGQGGNGLAAGAAGTYAQSMRWQAFAFDSIFGMNLNASKIFQVMDIGPASSGGSGGGGEGGAGNKGGGGGGAGSNGGIVFIFAKTWAGTFTISVTGGNGGNGGNGSNGVGAETNGSGGGGGSGGNGGITVVVYQTKTWSGSYTLTGGSLGTGGTTGSGGSGGGANGSNGVAGATGVSYELVVSNLTR